MDELEVLRIRDEVLQAMYWMRSEGISEKPTVEELSRFLALPQETLGLYLECFISDGLLESSDATFCLTALGEDAGKRTFAEEMAELTGSSHGECDDDCWCHDSPEAAADCLRERAEHVHSH